MMPIGGRVRLDLVMQRLTSVRPVFHSEADFQHAFGQVLHDLDPSLHVRLETYRDNVGYVDLLCYGSGVCTAVEFKYFTMPWQGQDPGTGEAFRLRNHAARDLARRNFVFDIARLERLHHLNPATDGIAIMLTNDPGLWKAPATSRTTRDQEFRIHEDRLLTGTLQWAGGSYPAHRRDLVGAYQLHWRDYSHLQGMNGTFRWLHIFVQ